MFNKRHYAILLAIVICVNLQYNPDIHLENHSYSKFKTSENNAEPTLQSLRERHVEDDHFNLPNNFTTLDFSITNSSEYIFAGYFSGSLILNASNSINSNSTSEDILVLRTDFNGTILDYFHAGGIGDDRVKGMDIDPFGNLYIAGFMGGNMTIGNTTYFTEDREGLVAKLGSNLNVIWSNNVTTHGNGNEISAVNWGSNNSIAIAGSCEGTKVSNVITSISFGTTVSYNRCGNGYTSNSQLTYNGIPLGGEGTNMFVGKLNETGEWQWAKKTEGCRAGTGGCGGWNSNSAGLNTNSTNVWHDSTGNIVAQGKSWGSNSHLKHYWCTSGTSYRGIVFGNFGINLACTPGIFSAKISSSGTVILVTNTEGGYWANTGGGSISGENVLGTGQFAFYTKSNQKIEQGDAQTGPNSCSSISEPVYHITWMNESLCTRDGYSRFGGTGTIESVRLTSGNSSEPQIIASFLGTGTITLGAKDIVLTAADTPVIGQINTSNGSASSTGFGWGWSIALPNYVGYSIQDIEVTSLGDVHVVLSSTRDTVLRITNDSDGDGVGKYSDKFPNDASQWNDFDNDGFGDEPTGNNPDGCVTQAGNSIWPVLGCPDYDVDGWADTRDRFPGDITQWNDSDWDGYGDNLNGHQPDACPNVYGESNRNITGAINGVGAIFGCQDSDFDGFSDSVDDCTNQYGNSIYGIMDGLNSSYVGCSDSDRDGYADIYDPCSLQYGSSWVDRLGCPDTDGDGISDLRDPHPNLMTNDNNDWDSDGYVDQRTWTNSDGKQYWINGTDVFPNDQSEWIDSDSDGFGDNMDVFPYDENESSDLDNDGIGDNADKCIFNPGNSTVEESLGCPDRDGDGWADMFDAFPYNSLEWLDSDTDGIGDNSDSFPYDPTETQDSDEDGVGDNADSFPYNPTETQDSDEDGVGDNSDAFPNDSAETKDSDEDGVGDNSDAFPNDPSETIDSDRDGYGDNIDEFDFDPQEWIDSDKDLIGDNEDLFPFDPSENSDRDVDGIGDNSDFCPDQPGSLLTIPIGCPDADRDGYADKDDKFKEDPNEWNDTDMDGIGDNSDDCVDIFGNSTNVKKGCIDTDGDGWADSVDFMPDDDKAWSDVDGDNFTDQPGLDISDDCPSQFGTSTITLKGCSDMDRDGYPDLLDPDADGDGILNTWEYQMDPISDPFDASEKPDDFDNDGIPDFFDEDDDGDGFPDSVEDQRGTDPFDEDSNPLDKYGGGVFYIPGEGFSSQYDPDGFEISIGAFINLITSIFLAPILLTIAAFVLMLRKKSRFKQIEQEIEESNNLSQLDNLELEIDDLLKSKRLKIQQVLLLKYFLRKKLKTFDGYIDESDISDSEIDEKNLVPIDDGTPEGNLANMPPLDAKGYGVNDGYEYIKWPEGSNDQWYRIAESNNEWQKWVDQ